MAKKRNGKVGIGGTGPSNKNAQVAMKPKKDKIKILLFVSVVTALLAIGLLILLLTINKIDEPADDATLVGVEELDNQIIFKMSDGTQIKTGTLPSKDAGNHEEIKIIGARIVEQTDAETDTIPIEIRCTDNKNRDYPVLWNIKKFGEGYSLKNAWINSDGYLIFEVKVNGEMKQIKQGQIMKLSTPEKEMNPEGASEYYDENNLPSDYAKVEIKVKGYGTITILVDKERARFTAGAFLKLVEEGYYDGLTFNKIFDKDRYKDPASYILGGISDKYAKPIDEIEIGELTNGISHKYGTISMYHENEEMPTSEFFICTGDNSAELDGEYVAFGYVISGMNIVEKISELTGSFSEQGVTGEDLEMARAKQAVIESMTIIENTK